MNKGAHLEVGLRSDRGPSRDLNEDHVDYVLVPDEAQGRSKGSIFVVADGMGGHQAGEVASREAVQKVIEAYYADPSDDPGKSLSRAMNAANHLVHQRASLDAARAGMGTTLVAAAVVGAKVYIANVGDSRAYGISRERITQITRDHSWVEEQIQLGILTREQAKEHPQRNVITRALGRRKAVKVDLFEGQLLPGDALLLCSDGVSGPLGDEQLAQAVRSLAPQQAAEQLVKQAAAAGGKDNASALIVSAVEPDRQPGAQAGPSSGPPDQGQPPWAPAIEALLKLGRRRWLVGAAAACMVLCFFAAVIFLPALTQTLAGDPVAAPLPAALQDSRLEGSYPDQVALYLGYVDYAEMAAAHGGQLAPESLGTAALMPAAPGLFLVGAAREWECQQQSCSFRLDMAGTDYKVTYQTPGEMGVDLSGHPVRVYGLQQGEPHAVSAQLIERGSHWWAWWQPAWTLVHQIGSWEQGVWVYSIVDRNPNGLLQPDQASGLQQGAQILLHGVWRTENESLAFEEDQVFALQGQTYVPLSRQSSPPLPTVTLQPTRTTQLDYYPGSESASSREQVTP